MLILFGFAFCTPHSQKEVGRRVLTEDEEGYEKFIDAVIEESVLFMKDLVVEASKESKDTEKNET